MTGSRSTYEMGGIDEIWKDEVFKGHFVLSAANTKSMGHKFRSPSGGIVESNSSETRANQHVLDMFLLVSFVFPSAGEKGGTVVDDNGVELTNWLCCKGLE
jgi:hypothetical protein